MNSTNDYPGVSLGGFIGVLAGDDGGSEEREGELLDSYLEGQQNLLMNCMGAWSPHTVMLLHPCSPGLLTWDPCVPGDP